MFHFIRTVFTIIALALFTSACNTHMQDFFGGNTGSNGPNDQGQPYVGGPTTPQYSAKLHNGVYKIGVMLPVSHPKAGKIAKSIKHSIELAFAYNNRPDIQLIFRDTKGDSATALAQVNELANQGVSMIIGPLYSTNVQAIQPITNKHKIIVLALTNDRAALGDGIQIMGFQPEDDARAIKQFINRRALRQVGLLSAMNVRGDRFVATFNGLGRKMMNTEIRRNHNGSDPAADVQGLVGQNNAVILANTGKQLRWELSYVADAMANIIENHQADLQQKNANQDHAKPERPAVADLIKHANLHQIDLPLIIGTRDWNHSSILSEKGADRAMISMYDQQAYNQFSMQFKNQMGYEPHYMTGIGYDAMLLAKSIIERGYSNIFNGSMHGVYGRYRFSRSGVIEREYMMYENNRGQLRPVY
jgi:outer membrane PBP1 activator LpoA protein